MSNQKHLLSTCRLLEFQDARVDEISADFSPYLIVSGLLPYANIRVELLPRMYIKRPEYWSIEVVGTLSRLALPSVTPYEIILPLDFPVGTKGIRILGSGGTMKEIEYVFKTRPNPDDGGKDVIVMGPQEPRA